MSTLTPEQKAKIHSIVDAMPPMSDEAIGRVSAIMSGIRQRQHREALRSGIQRNTE